jgi:hypothetical protein
MMSPTILLGRIPYRELKFEIGIEMIASYVLTAERFTIYLPYNSALCFFCGFQFELIALTPLPI